LNPEPAKLSQDRTRDRLLLLLKTRDGLSTKALAQALDISVPAVRQHLSSLGDQVCAESVASGVGRPAQIWRLTAKAQSKFPDTHAELSVKLIESIEHSLGAAALEKVIADRYVTSLRQYRERLSGVGSVHGKLKRLVQIRSDEGYMAELRRTHTGWLLIENHCPICAAATHCQGFCRNELELFRELLGTGVCVDRIEYLLDGGSRCSYEISIAAD
jgi:predicted ArsR family transcriptional regulator